jgi:two-component system OmpR family response regulator
MRILIAEDDDALRERLVAVFSRAFYLPETATNGEDAEFLGITEQFDAVVLDLGLPMVDGLTILRRWREAGIDTPVLCLTARDTWRDKVAGLRAGADDYLGKPFEAEELLARIEALIRRTYGRSEPNLRIGPVEIDLARRMVCYNCQDIDLTAMEFRTLHYLAINAGRVVGQEELIQHIYSQDVELASNVVEVIVSRIRKKLFTELITTRRGHGYIVSAEH